MLTNVFDSMKADRVYAGYRDAEGGKELTDSLVTMAKKGGFRFDAALDLANQLMDQVHTYDNVQELVREDVQEAMEKVFSALETLEPEARLDAMNQMLFGLNMVSDETLLNKLDAGKDPMELFQNSSGKYLPTAPKAEQQLREAILRKVSNLHISAKALNRMSKTIAGSSDLVATSAALGRKGHALKCLVAMELYLNNRDSMDVDEAVLMACETVELEAVSDALRVGEISEITVTALTIASLVTLIIIAALIKNAAVLKILLSLLGTLTVASMLSIDGKDLFEILGEKAALVAGYVKSGVETFRAGMDRICGYMEEEIAPAADPEEEEPFFDTQEEEAYI